QPGSDHCKKGHKNCNPEINWTGNGNLNLRYYEKDGRDHGAVSGRDRWVQQIDQETRRIIEKMGRPTDKGRLFEHRIPYQGALEGDGKKYGTVQWPDSENPRRDQKSTVYPKMAFAIDINGINCRPNLPVIFWLPLCTIGG